MLLSVSNISQRNYTISSRFPQKVNLSLQCGFCAQTPDGFSAAELSAEDREKFDKIMKALPPKSILELENLRKNRILTNKTSNDNSSALDNLYKILTTQRAPGLDNRTLLAETIGHLNNPYRISQKSDNSVTSYIESIFNIQGSNRAAKDSSTCTAACIEFDLAKKEPAEFTRFVEGLTSPDLAVEKTIDLDNLADKTLDAIWLLNIFEIPHEETNFNKIKTTLKPDKNVLLKVGLNKRNPAAGSTQRNTIDTILQSTFMNVGSQQSYDSLTDRRAGNFKVTERGLIEYEKTFVESVVRNKNIISVNYQKINQDGEITGYETDFQTIKSQLLDTLNLGENIIAGITNKTKNKKLRGHEIVITGVQNRKDGKTEFICYNSDLDKTTPVTYSEDYLLPKIHHAGIPKEVVLKTMGFKEGWIMELENYRAIKQFSAAPPR